MHTTLAITVIYAAYTVKPLTLILRLENYTQNSLRLTTMQEIVFTHLLKRHFVGS